MLLAAAQCANSGIVITFVLLTAFCSSPGSVQGNKLRGSEPDSGAARAAARVFENLEECRRVARRSRQRSGSELAGRGEHFRPKSFVRNTLLVSHVESISWREPRKVLINHELLWRLTLMFEILCKDPRKVLKSHELQRRVTPMSVIL
jgi:hypothetical protein